MQREWEALPFEEHREALPFEEHRIYLQEDMDVRYRPFGKTADLIVPLTRIVCCLLSPQILRYWIQIEEQHY